jgi:hypothetical protein
VLEPARSKRICEMLRFIRRKRGSAKAPSRAGCS